MNWSILKFKLITENNRLVLLTESDCVTQDASNSEPKCLVVDAYNVDSRIVIHLYKLSFIGLISS